MARKQKQTATLPARADPTSDYARKILAGDILAGKFVRASCQRHLDDLKDGHRRGLTFDLDRADDALGFFPAMFTVTGGAKAGDPFHLLDWMTFVVGSLFGWRRSDGLRRFRSAWIETGKGQAKSPLLGAIGVYMMAFNGIPRAECYAISTSRDQAKILFNDAVSLCKSPIPGRDGETLEGRGDIIVRGVGDNAWKLEHPTSQSKFLPVAASDSMSGPKPVFVAADEVHEMRTDRAIQIWKAAIDKMAGDPLMIMGTNTPASDQAVGTDYSDLYQRIATGDLQDDSAFSYIARVDETDKPFEDESCWIKALPAIGVTYPFENIRSRVLTSRNMASERIATERLYFGIPTGSSGFWIDEASWNSCQGEIHESDLADAKCFLSLDLSEKNDLTALSACFQHENDDLSVRSHYWTSANGIEQREVSDKVGYRAYAEHGDIIVVPGAKIDYTYVAAEVAEYVAKYDVDSLTVDPAMFNEFLSACDQIGLLVWRYMGPGQSSGRGLKIVTHAQGTRIAFEDRQLCMPHSISRLTDKILSGEITIEKNRITTMCAANSVIVSDGMANQAFDKRRSKGRIDGMVTIAMAVGASKSVKKAKKSYMSSGVLTT